MKRMFVFKHFFSLIVLHSTVAIPQINLYYASASDGTLQRDCLRIATLVEQANFSRQIMWYCVDASASNISVENDVSFPNFTFAELSKQNISSEQLYLWSASIDLIEDYQWYLNQLSTSNHSLSAEEDVFYNCTFPRFGPKCQYQFNYQHRNDTSLYELISQFYLQHQYLPIHLTCYEHLQCDRGPSPACLDWSEICDGKFDCLDSELDEEHCWQLDVNQCEENEYQCTNGQCIPLAFYDDDQYIPDCLDWSDELRTPFQLYRICSISEPSIRCEDVTCGYEPHPRFCASRREDLLSEAIFSMKDDTISNDCWSAFKCILVISDLTYTSCQNLYQNESMFAEIIEATCPEMLYIPSIPVLFRHVYFAYHKNDARSLVNWEYVPPYICYNNSHYDDYLVNASKVLFDNNTICYRNYDTQSLRTTTFYWDSRFLAPLRDQLWEYHLIWKYNQTLNSNSAKCNRSNMYQCAHSLRCIPGHYLVNGVKDCPHGDDENITEHERMKAVDRLVGIESRHADKIIKKLRTVRKDISFQIICDGFTELSPHLIDGRNETDETECEQWQCNNIYTRCNDIWNCLDGADEVGCNLSSSFKCSSDEHICVSPNTNQFICLPLNQANDGKVDCLGATDEPTRCRKVYSLETDPYFYCMNDTSPLCVRATYLCDGRIECGSGNADEQFCEKNRAEHLFPGLCHSTLMSSASDVEKFICNSVVFKNKQQIKYFILDETIKSGEDPVNDKEISTSPSRPDIPYKDPYDLYCHRGLNLRTWLNDQENESSDTCLCPPSFYGNRCEYQNQRISLTLRFRIFSDSYRTLFAVVVSLIDDSDEGTVHSSEQFSFLSMRDCKVKFHIYLFYSTRPKDPTKNYSIHIDIYDKLSLSYRTSLLFPVAFAFLPVHRLAFIIDIPGNNTIARSCLDDRCNHGRCIRYSNDPNNRTLFCQCEEGWSGQYCHIQHKCMCSSDSICFGVAANNRSICVCPVTKFGPRCLINTVCQTNDTFTCQNGGQCIPNDDFIVSDQKFVCICREGFIGNRCQFTENSLILSFSEDVPSTQSIFIHFIEVITNHTPVRATTFKPVPLRQDSVTIYWSRPFHLVFIELTNKAYYLAVVQKTYNRSTAIRSTIKSEDRCRHISEVLNKTIVQWHLLRRMKYYHLPCQIYAPHLQCFYDDLHLCLCYDHGRKRLANCLKFEHNMTFDCSGQSVCQNDAKCLQDHPDCPSRSICMCPPCVYGRQCQWSTSDFGLSLDAILGYHILPHLSFADQPTITKTSVALTVIFLVAGLINGVLCLITFKSKVVCEVGCGLYLIGSSVTTLLTMTMFALKFLFLLLTQMTIISDRLFLLFQCRSMDFVLRICLCMDQWLNACVALERAIAAMKGINFVKKKSRQAAKYVIIILLIVIISSCAHDPVHRSLLDEENDDDDDDNQKRTWCIVKYSSSLEIYNYIIHILHFFGPFLINFISAIVLIIKQSRQRTISHQQKSYQEHLQKQCQQHKNLLTAPVLLVILAVPRLIITFVSKCMQSASDSWLFLGGYLISFIPPMLTFFIFIIPSKFYRKEFRKSFAYYWNHLRWHSSSM